MRVLNRTKISQALIKAYSSAYTVLGVVWLGQSNQQGATLTDNGGKGFKFTSLFTGQSEPFLLNNNGGGSCLPLLLDLGLQRGVRYFTLNSAVGGAELAYYPGRVGATITGQSVPIATMNSSGSSMSAGTGAICRPGDAGFDPFGLLARVYAEMLKYPQITQWIVHCGNAESDAGTGQIPYRDTHVSIADYFFGLSGVNVIAYFAALSASGANTATNMNRLSAGVDDAIALLKSQGKPAYKGADLYAAFGMSPPLYFERSAPTTKVHLTGESQRVQGELANQAIFDGLR